MRTEGARRPDPITAAALRSLLPNTPRGYNHLRGGGG